MTAVATAPGGGRRRLVTRAGRYGLPLVLIAAMALGTRVVSDNSALASGQAAFSPTAFARAGFPRVQAVITRRAVPAAGLAVALNANQGAAIRRYGQAVPGAPGPELSVRFTGVAGADDDDIYPVTVPGLPKGLLIRLQAGPVIIGTDLRDASGLFSFGQFTDQIDYENAATALNDELKREVLDHVDTQHLTGKTVTVIGAFDLINPDGWLVTPVKLSAS